MKKENCTKTTNGKIIAVKAKGLDFPTIVSVEYEVAGVKYTHHESLKLKSTTIKLGFIPIGQKKMPKINATVGSNVEICYNPEDPQEAYIVGNDGIINS